MNTADPVQRSMEVMLEAGFDGSECSLNQMTRKEVSLEQGTLDLLSTIEDTNLFLTGVCGDRRASTRISRCSEEELTMSAGMLKGLADASPEDPAFSIAPFQESRFRAKGLAQPDVSGMVDRLNELREHCSSRYPDLNLRRVTLNFLDHRHSYGNTNGTSLSSRVGLYVMNLIFASRRHDQVSSFSYVTLRFPDLERPLFERANLDDLLSKSTEQLGCRRIPGSFTGDVILAPNCLDYFLYLLTLQLQDGALIRGTSLFGESLGEKVADESFSFSITPDDPQLAHSSFITPDGFPSANQDVIRNGVLVSHLLSHYGACKTGLTRAKYYGDFYGVQPGDCPLEEMVAGVEKGLLVYRFSGGMPDENGSFSGVAKNSYYIENGKVQYPVKEAMMRMNLKGLLKSIAGISFERLNLGAVLLPWIQVSSIPVE